MRRSLRRLTRRRRRTRRPGRCRGREHAAPQRWRRDQLDASAVAVRGAGVPVRLHAPGTRKKKSSPRCAWPAACTILSSFPRSTARAARGDAAREPGACQAISDPRGILRAVGGAPCAGVTLRSQGGPRLGLQALPAAARAAAAAVCDRRGRARRVRTLRCCAHSPRLTSCRRAARRQRAARPPRSCCWSRTTCCVCEPQSAACASTLNVLLSRGRRAQLHRLFYRYRVAPGPAVASFKDREEVLPDGSCRSDLSCSPSVSRSRSTTR